MLQVHVNIYALIGLIYQSEIQFRNNFTKKIIQDIPCYLLFEIFYRC